MSTPIASILTPISDGTNPGIGRIPPLQSQTEKVASEKYSVVDHNKGAQRGGGEVFSSCDAACDLIDNYG